MAEGSTVESRFPEVTGVPQIDLGGATIGRDLKCSFSIVVLVGQHDDTRSRSFGQDTHAAKGLRNPYKGLTSYTYRDAGWFFGRDDAIDRCWTSLQAVHSSVVDTANRERLLCILGPSGSGKSSLVSAGLVPQLRRRPVDGLPSPRVVLLRPGSRPLERLAVRLADLQVNDRAPQLEKVRVNESVLAQPSETGAFDGLRKIVEALPEELYPALLLVVDQFEEVFQGQGYVPGCDQRQPRAFIDNLLTAVADPGGRLSAIITLRSDFLRDVATHGKLDGVISRQSVLVPAFTVAELADVVTKPALRAGRPVDAPAVARLVAETYDRRGALPLLQVALSAVWQGLLSGASATETLDAVGGVGGALAHRAEQIFGSLDDEERRIARRAFLATVDDDGSRYSKRRVRVSDIVAAGAPEETVLAVLRRFTEETTRMLVLYSHDTSGTPNAEPCYELVHEATIERWNRLHRWVEEGREDEKYFRVLNEAADRWRRERRRSRVRAQRFLWGTPDLEALRAFHHRNRDEMTDAQVSFYRASEARHRNRRVARLSVAMAMIVLAVASTFFAFSFRRALDLAKIESRRATVERLASDAFLATGGVESGLDVGLLLAVEAVLQSDGRIGWGPVLQGLVARPELLSHIQDEAKSVAFSIDEQMLLVGSSTSVRLWDVSRPTRPASMPTAVTVSDGQRIEDARFSPSGELIALLVRAPGVAGHQDFVELYSTKEPFGTSRIAEVRCGIDYTFAISFSVSLSSDSLLCVGGDRDGAASRMEVWSVGPDHVPRLLSGLDEPTGRLHRIAVNPDGRLLAWYSEALTLLVRVSDEGELIEHARIEHQAQRAVAFHPREALLYASRGSSIVQVSVDPTGARETPYLEIEGSAVRSLSFHRTLPVLLVESTEAVQAWQVREDGAPTFIRQIPAFSAGFEISPNGTYTAILVPSQARVDLISTRAFTMPGERPLENRLIVDVLRLEDAEGVTALDFASLAQVLIVGTRTGSVFAWELTEAGGRNVFSRHSLGQITTIAVSPRGEYAFVGTSEGVLHQLQLRDGPSDAVASFEFGARISSIASSSSGRYIVVGFNSGQFGFWDLVSPALGPWLVDAYEFDPVTHVAMSSDEALIATIGGINEGTVKLWRVQAGRGPALAQVIPRLDDMPAVMQTTFSSSSGRLAIAGMRSGGVFLFDLAAPSRSAAATQPLLTRSAVEMGVYNVQFLAGDAFILVSDLRGRHTVWDVRDPVSPVELGAIWVAPSIPMAGSTVAANLAGSLLAIASKSGVVVFDVHPLSWLRRACTIAGRELTEWERAKYSVRSDTTGSCEAVFSDPRWAVQ